MSKGFFIRRASKRASETDYCGLIAFLCAFLVMSSCARTERREIQRLELKSGQFGIPSSATVVSIDFIDFESERGPNPRYSRSVSYLAQEWLERRGEPIDSFLYEFVGEFSENVAAEIEEFIRAAGCIYVVKPEDQAFMREVTKEISTQTKSVEEIVLEQATDDQMEELWDLNDREFDLAVRELAIDMGLIGSTNESTQASSTDIIEIAVASQCLIGVHVGDNVSVFAIDDYIAISKPRSEVAYVNTR